MPVYFVWNRKSYFSNGTAKSVGSHNVPNTRCHGISVGDCAKTEKLSTAYEAVLRPGTRTTHTGDDVPFLSYDERFEHPARTWASSSHRKFTHAAVGIAMAAATFSI